MLENVYLEYIEEIVVVRGIYNLPADPRRRKMQNLDRGRLLKGCQCQMMYHYTPMTDYRKLLIQLVPFSS